MSNRVQLNDTMQTTCPNCGSVFRVTSAELESGFGRVRCGVCQKEFNALLNLENYHGEPVELLPDTPPPETAPDDSSHESPTDSLSTRTDTSSGDAGESVSLHQAMYGDGHKSPTNLKPLLWFVGILILLILAIVQVIYYQRYALISSVHYQPQILSLCQILPCDEKKFFNASQFRLLERNIFTHPTRPDALMVSGSFVNQAPFSQPLPRLLISLSDQSGNFIASRLFEPEQYLADPSISRLAPGKSVPFRLELKDPGNTALAYEFEFFR